MENKTVINDKDRTAITPVIPNLLSGILDAVSGKEKKVIRFDYRYADTAKLLSRYMRGRGNGDFTTEDIRRAIVEYATSLDRRYLPVPYEFGFITDPMMYLTLSQDDINGEIVRFVIKDELCHIDVRMNKSELSMPLLNHPKDYCIDGCYKLADDTEILSLVSMSICRKSESRCR